MSAKALDPKKFAEAAIKSIGLGYDLTNDLKFNFCKRNFPDPRLIAIDDDQLRTIELPNGISVSNVSKSIKCDKGERMRLCSDVLSFQQMSEQFNQELSLSGKIPSGYFNTAFELSEAWQREAANTKSLAFDGVSITLYNIALEKTQVVLRDHVKQSVPSSWDPAALARFIEKFGTHVIVGVKIGGTDMIYAKQPFLSSLQPTDVQRKLKEFADEFFVNGSGQYYTKDEKLNQKDKFFKELGLDMTAGSSSYCTFEVQDIKFMCKRRGGINKRNSHSEWCQTVSSQADVISMSFIPITSLLNGVNGSGFLTHAINLYLRYKPPLNELHQFLEFQLPRQWAPVFGELALGLDRKPQSMASLQFSLMGPKLHVNTSPVDVGDKPVTGVRLYLEGKKSNRLAIHLQHLSSQPQTFQLEIDKNGNVPDPTFERKYFEKVQWKSFSHVCTAPVDLEDEDNSIVTGARFEVKDHGLKKVLYLRLTFAKVIGATRVRAPDWHGSPSLTQKSGMMSALISGRFSNAAQKPLPNPADVHINSALYPNGPPMPTQTPKLLKFVDTTEITKGPQDTPGYWVVSGARLFMENGKISLKVKYSLLTVIPPDEEGTSF